MDLVKLKSQIQSLLFASPKPVSIPELLDVLGVSETDFRNALAEIIVQNQSSGIVLLAHHDKLQMVSNPDNSALVKKFLSADLREKLSDAGLETLAVICYRQPVSRAEIENIRGVNSQYILRQLLIRGLIEKIESVSDRRINHYRTTLEFMQHLGIKDMRELPSFEDLTKNINLPSPATNS